MTENEITEIPPLKPAEESLLVMHSLLNVLRFAAPSVAPGVTPPEVGDGVISGDSAAAADSPDARCSDVHCSERCSDARYSVEQREPAA